MRNRIKFILDIGSSKISLLATTQTAKRTRIVAEECILYDGYMDGEFLSPDDLGVTMGSLVDNMYLKLGKKVDSVIVGVPSEFCICVCKRISRKFTSLHKVTTNDIVSLYNANSNFNDSEQYSLLSYSAMQYMLDNSVTTPNPVGAKTHSITMDASFVLAKRDVLLLLEQALNQAGVRNVEYICTALGQAMNLGLDSAKPVAIVDVGHISTSVAVYKGEGLALLTSFSMGGGHVSSDIMQVLGMTFKEAELIKRKVILTIESNRNDYYEVCSKGSLVKAPINMTNQVVRSRLEKIAKVIGQILNLDDVFASVDIYLTGDGIANFKGVKNILKEKTGHDVYDYKVPFDNSKDKFQTSKHGLAALAESIQ